MKEARKPKKVPQLDWDVSNYGMRVEFNPEVKAWLDADHDRVIVLLADNRKQFRKLYGTPYDTLAGRAIWILKDENERAEFVIHSDNKGSAYEIVGGRINSGLETCLKKGDRIIEFLSELYDNLRGLQTKTGDAPGRKRRPL